MEYTNKIRQKIQHAITQRLFPGCVIGLIKTRKRHIIREGHFTYDGDSPKMDQNSIFDVASITKSIPVACLALKLIEKGHLSLYEKIIKYIPELQNDYRQEIQVKHLLTQTLNFGYQLASLKDYSPNRILNLILRIGVQEPPGTSFHYANATSILLGILIERIANNNLENLSQELLFNPLKMARATFFTKKLPLAEIVPTEIDQWRKKEIRGEIHDETAWKLQKIMIPGSAGLFSTANDLLNFAEMLLNQGIFHEKKIFKKTSINQMHTNQIGYLKEYTGLGFELNQPQWMGKKCTQETFGKTGFTGCSLLVDVSRQTGLVILSNCTYPQRKKDKREINEFRRKIAEIAME